MQLRPYQQEAVSSIFRYYEEGGNGHPLISLPTASGKGKTLSEFTRQAVQDYGSRVFIATYVAELVQQDYDEMLEVFPNAPVGIYCAGLNRKELHKQIVIGTLQSLRKAVGKIKNPPDLLIIDECQVIANDEATSYRKFIADLTALNPDLKVIGFSATCYRMGQGMLHKGEGALFTDLIYDKNIAELIKEGYLSPLVTKSTSTKLDTTGVSTRLGDFAIGELERAVDKDDINEAAVDEAIRMGQDRKGWLFFCCGISHANHIAEILNKKGYPAAAITADTPKEVRKQIIADFKAQKLRALCSMNVLAVGFNAPHADMGVCLRPTKSTGLWVQMVGRLTRLSPGKANGLVADMAGNTLRFGPIDALTVEGKKKGSGDAPVKICENCQSYMPISIKVCKDCGHEFPINAAPKFQAKAFEGAILSGQPSAPQELRVDSIKYGLHQKEGRPPCMRVTYQCGLLSVSEFIHFEINIPRAERWWRSRSSMSLPKNAKQALVFSKSLKVPSAIIVKQNGKYLNVEGHLWSNVPYVQEKQTGTAGVFQQALTSPLGRF